MKNLIKASIAMAAFAALFVLPSVASAITLTAPTGTPVPINTNLIATNVAHAATGKNTLFTTNLGTVTCETATLTGPLLTNGPNHVLGEITTAQFDSNGGPCTSPVGNATVTPNHITNPCHTPTGGSAHCSLPWCVTAGKEDKIQVWGKTSGESCHSPSGGVTGPTFTLHTAIAGTCSYTKKNAGPLTATYTTHPNDAIATVDPNQPYVKLTGGGFCPNEGELDMAFTMTKDNNHVSGEATYIDSV